MVGAARFELATPSPPDWCANRAALRSDATRAGHSYGFSASGARLSSFVGAVKSTADSKDAAGIARRRLPRSGDGLRAWPGWLGCSTARNAARYDFRNVPRGSAINHDPARWLRQTV